MPNPEPATNPAAPRATTPSETWRTRDVRPRRTRAAAAAKPPIIAAGKLATSTPARAGPMSSSREIAGNTGAMTLYPAASNAPSTSRARYARLSLERAAMSISGSLEGSSGALRSVSTIGAAAVPRSRLSSRRHEPDPRRGRRRRAVLRLHERLSRRRERDRHERLDARAHAAHRGRLRGAAELRRRLHLAQGRDDGRQGDRRSRRRDAEDRPRRRRRGHRLEPDDLAARAADELEPRAHRRRDGLGGGGERMGRRQRSRAIREGPAAVARVAGPRRR